MPQEPNTNVIVVRGSARAALTRLVVTAVLVVTLGMSAAASAGQGPFVPLLIITALFGMVEVRGPNVFVGYWRMPEKTAEELKPDGFFITGDLGRFDADGYLHIVGRGKDLVITGGYNVYPKEVEQAIDDLPGVMESAVIGVPHPDLGEVPLAVVVPEAGVRLAADVLAAALKDKLARFKQPRAWEIVEALPRNTMGKVQKNVLRERFGGAFTG